MAQQENQPLTKEVDEVLQGKRVFCFAKFYKAEKNYTIMQLYMEHELAASELAKLEHFNVPHAVQSPEQSAKEDSQFFTPSMGNALEEPADSVASASTVQHPPPSKRTLVFGSVTPPVPEDIPLKITPTVNTPLIKHGKESPIKKSKNKEAGK